MTAETPPSGAPIARRHMRIAGVLTGCTGCAVPAIVAIVAILAPSVRGGGGGDVAIMGGPLVTAVFVLVLSALGIAIAAFAIFVGNTIRRGGESSRFWVSVLGPVAFMGGVALYPAEAAGSSFPVVSILVAMYGAALIGLVVPSHIELSARGEWLRRRGALSALALSAIVALLLAPAAAGAVHLIKSAESRARLRNTLPAQSIRCADDHDICLEGRVLTNYCGHVASVAWSTDGAFVAAVGKRLRVWSVAPPQRIDASLISGEFVAIATAPTGGPVVAVCRGWSCDVLTPGDAAAPHSIIECSDGRVPRDAYPRAPLAFAPDGSRFVLAGDALCANELPSGRVMRQFGEGCANRYDAVAFSPDGKNVAAICDGTLTLWDPDTGIRRDKGASRVLPQVRSRSALAFSFDGRAVIVLAAEASSDVLYAFDAIGGSQQTRVELGSRGDRTTPFAVLPNGRVLVGGEKSCVWDLASAKALGCVAERSDTLATSVGGTSSMVALAGTDMLAGADIRTDTQCPATTRTLKAWSSADLAALGLR
jgi:hypothetical protein